MRKRSLIFTVLVFLSHAGLVAVGADQTAWGQEAPEEERPPVRDSVAAISERGVIPIKRADNLRVFGNYIFKNERYVGINNDLFLMELQAIF